MIRTHVSPGSSTRQRKPFAFKAGSKAPAGNSVADVTLLISRKTFLCDDLCIVERGAAIAGAAPHGDGRPERAQEL
jgi:hypothetical protein